MDSKQKQQLIKLGRESIESEFSENEISIPIKLQEILIEERGVFVTLYKNKHLRGCIGYPQPVHPLGIAIVKAAKAAAFDDSRFPPLEKSELKEIKIEITILTKPKKIKASPKNIRIGKDGLLIKKDSHQGLLLPQVATEFKLDAKQFLEQTCLKAGLLKDAWKDAEVYTFQGEIIKEA